MTKIKKIYFKKIQEIKHFINNIHKETQKIIWSNKKETLQITTIIFISSTIISIILWALDRSIFYIISFIIQLRF